MATVRYTDDGGRYRAGGVTFEAGAREAAVADGLAEHLVENTDSFEYVDDTAEADDNGDRDDADDGTETTGVAQEQWLDRDYQDREQAVLDGEVDEHLGKILQGETSETVKDAVDERRED